MLLFTGGDKVAGLFPDLRQLHQAYPSMGNDQAVLQSMMMLNPMVRDQMIQDAAKVRFLSPFIVINNSP